jgi:hypothetical protein
MRNAPRIYLPIVALMIVLLCGCSDDDPVSPGVPLWREVDAELGAGDSRLLALDFNGSYGVALGVVVPPGGGQTDAVHEFFRLRPDGSWLKDDALTVRPGMVALDLTVDTTGKIVLAGFQWPPAPASVVLDFRQPVAQYVEQASYGMLTVDGEGAFLVAGGRSRGGGLWTSTAPGVWSFDDLPLTGTNDSGFRDVDVRGDRAVACGYDDGADTLQVILTRTTTTGWQKIQPAGPGTRTYFCVALSEAGTIFVGGIDGAGGVSPKAFLTQRLAGGQWAELLLPEPELLHGVMDILIASDGDIYLACMGEGDRTKANLIHADSSGVRNEITPFPGGLLQVAEGPDGSIYAVGFRRDEGTGAERGVMLVRSP